MRTKFLEGFELAIISEIPKFCGDHGLNLVREACNMVDEIAHIYERKNLEPFAWQDICACAERIKAKWRKDGRVTAPSFIEPWGV
jgi:hypothetical protein